MGPHFFKCGNVGAFPSIDSKGKASMGPHFFKCGNWEMATLAKPVMTCASMGPHFFKCGN